MMTWGSENYTLEQLLNRWLKSEDRKEPIQANCIQEER